MLIFPSCRGVFREGIKNWLGFDHIVVAVTLTFKKISLQELHPHINVINSWWLYLAILQWSTLRCPYCRYYSGHMTYHMVSTPVTGVHLLLTTFLLAYL